MSLINRFILHLINVMKLSKTLNSNFIILTYLRLKYVPKNEYNYYINYLVTDNKLCQT